PDDKYFVVMLPGSRESSKAPPQQINITLNWFEELKQRRRSARKLAVAWERGSRLVPYEILACIGAGGMGEVYRARDTRLARDVAIKISAQQFSERFEREA